ncbi:hypothetical protein CsSME_00036367 [Camellia sinensis var. sinensis]
MSKYDDGDKVNPTYFKTGLVSRYIEEPKTPHLKAAKRIL